MKKWLGNGCFVPVRTPKNSKLLPILRELRQLFRPKGINNFAFILGTYIDFKKK
jgi:hypothetical protein